MAITRMNAERRIAYICIFSLLTAISLLPACGGGGGGGSAGGGVGTPGDPIPPDPIRLNPGPGIDSGLVIGRGSADFEPQSVIVNGVQFGAGAAPSFRVGFGDAAGSVDNVKVGMVLTMRGNFDSVDNLGAYDNVLVEPQVIGPAVVVDGGPTFIVLGQTVNVTRFTVFDNNVPGGAVAGGNPVEVHGYFTGPNTIEATHIRLGTADQLQVRGVVTALDNDTRTLSIGAQQVSFPAPAPIPAGLADGRFVEVEGNGPLQADNILVATKVELHGFAFEEDKEIEVEGSVQSHTPGAAGAGTFVLRGPFGTDNVAYNTAFATRFELEERNTLSTPAILDEAIARQLTVEVEGRLIGGILQAREIELRRSENVVLEGNVFSVSAADNTFTLSPFTSAQFSAPFTLTLAAGVSVPQEGHVEVGGNVVPGTTAVTVTRITPITDPLQAAKVILQGPVTDFSATDNTMVVLGYFENTVGLRERDVTDPLDPAFGPSEFTNAANRRVTRRDFFSLLQSNVTVVKGKAETGVAPIVEQPSASTTCPASPPRPCFRPLAGVEIEPHR